MVSTKSGKREYRKGSGSGFAQPRFQKSEGLSRIDGKKLGAQLGAMLLGICVETWHAHNRGGGEGGHEHER